MLLLLWLYVTVQEQLALENMLRSVMLHALLMLTRTRLGLGDNDYYIKHTLN